jgi:WS/DGAT/MGAT family acyltransferase
MKAPELARRLSGVDAAFLYLERNEIPLHIAAVCVFDGEIPFGPFVRSIRDKLRLLPRYRQIVIDPPFHLGYPTWQDDPEFNIRRHIFHRRLPPPGGRDQLEALAGEILSQVMDRRKPLWDIHIVDGLEGGRGAAITRVHHALADGIAGASLMKTMLDPTASARPEPHGRRKNGRRAKDPSIADALASALHSSLQSMIAAEAVLLDFSRALLEERTREALQDLVKLLPELAESSQRLFFNKPCTGERRFCWTEFEFEEVKSIREAAAGATVNDVVLTIVTSAVARYLRAHGEPVRGRFLRVVCPVNARQDRGESLGNQISFLPVALPLGIENPMAALHAVTERTCVMKNARAAHLIALLAAWLGAAPPPLQALFWGAIPQAPLPVSLLHMICTNVPGSATPLYAGGRKMIASYPHVPTGYELGVNCAFQSYDGKLFCGLTADANVVPDAGRLRDLIHRSFAELREAAFAGPAARATIKNRH